MKYFIGFLALCMVIAALPYLAAIIIALLASWGLGWIVLQLFKGSQSGFTPESHKDTLNDTRTQPEKIRSAMTLQESREYDQEVVSNVRTSSNRGEVEPLSFDGDFAHPGVLTFIAGPSFYNGSESTYTPHEPARPKPPVALKPPVAPKSKQKKPIGLREALVMAGNTPYAKIHPEYQTALRRIKFSLDLINKEGISVPKNIQDNIVDVIEQLNKLNESGIQDTAQGKRMQKKLSDTMVKMANVLENLADSVYDKKLSEIENFTDSLQAQLEMEGILNNKDEIRIIKNS